MFGQRYDANGTPQGLEFQVNVEEEGNQYWPRVAMAPDGAFAVVYQDADLGEVEFDVKMNTFDAQGQPIQEIELNTFTDREQREPAVAAAGASGFIAVWESHGGEDGDGAGVFARRFFGPSATDQVEFCVPETVTGAQHQAAVGGSADRVVVVWQHTGAGMDFWLRARVLPVVAGE